MRHGSRRLWLGFLAGVAVAAPAGATVLYDGALGTSPSSQGYLGYASYVNFPVPAGNQFSVGSSSVTLDSTNDANLHSGFASTGSPPVPVLDRTQGFTVHVDLRTISENHANANRAGFSLIALGSDHKGVEIGFWNNEVWAQNTDFTHSATESSLPTAPSFVTTGSLRAYDLAVTGDAYTLSSGGTQLFTGQVKDYSGSGATPNVYATNNFLFFGDDTTSASGATEVSSLSVAIPEPATGACLTVLAAACGLRRRRPCRAGAAGARRVPATLGDDDRT